ncbi:MAG: SpoIID/LytB domain-containing protein, partial [Thermostichus sp. DG02_5_bins_236]
AEMGASFLPEALKAQAVAARSYVLYHRNSRGWFDVFSDTRSQVYRGLSQRSVAALEATRATRGVVMVYGGQFVNAMYSASSGGQTVGVSGIPYLMSLPDVSPYPKHGHGIGMSQWGAQEFARQGWNYQQILAYYYRGVGLGRLPE